MSKRELGALAQERDSEVISVYLPTHRRGREIEQDPIRLKNMLSEVEERLAEQGVERGPLAGALESVGRLVDDTEFWRHQGEGLAVLASPEGVRAERLTAPVGELAYVGRRHCVRPLLPSVTDASTFYILAISQNAVRLLHCGHESAREMDGHDIPSSIRDAVGYDWEQKSLQFHTGAQPVARAGKGAVSMRAAVFHGQGAGEDDAKEEIERFFRLVDEGVVRLTGREAPLVLAAVEFEAAMYRSLTRRPKVLEEAILGSHEHRSAAELHADALPLVEPHLSAEAQRHRDRLGAAKHSSEVAGVEDRLEGVLPAAREGRIEALFIDPEAPVWGRFDDGRVEVHDDRRAGDDDLLDLAVALSLASGAEVAPMSRSDLPSDQPVAALLRY